MRKAEKFLWQLKSNKDTIRRRLEDIEAREAALGLLGISYDSIRVQTSPKDKMCEGIAELLDACDGLFKELAAEQKKTMEIERVVSQLTPVKQQIVYLHFRYGMDFNKVALRINYSRSQTYRIYAELLNDVEKIMEATE